MDCTALAPALGDAPGPSPSLWSLPWLGARDFGRAGALPCACLQVPMARASILWLIGEYCEHVPKIAPDVLRKMAKSFTGEEDIVKLQVINLAAKLYLTNSKQVSTIWVGGTGSEWQHRQLPRLAPRPCSHHAAGCAPAGSVQSGHCTCS